jgi:acetyltransferase-like isoleucine patch superfamily enzyme
MGHPLLPLRPPHSLTKRKKVVWKVPYGIPARPNRLVITGVRHLKNIVFSVRAQALRLGGTIVGGAVVLRQNVHVRPVRLFGKNNIVIGSDCELQEGTCLHAWEGSIHLAEKVFLGCYTVVYGQGGVTIGRETRIAMHCRILSSTHSILLSEAAEMPDTLLPTKIGRNVWLGAGVTVLGGVEIGDYCVVGAAALVTKSLPPYSVAYGVPAKVVGVRK